MRTESTTKRRVGLLAALTVAATTRIDDTSSRENSGSDTRVLMPLTTVTASTISIAADHRASHTTRRETGSAWIKSSRPAFSSPAVRPDATVIASAESKSGSSSAYTCPST